MRDRRTPLAVWFILLLGGMLALASRAPAGNGPAVRRVPLGRRWVLLQIDTPQAARATGQPAWNAAAGRRVSRRVGLGYTLHNRVLVRVCDAAALERYCARHAGITLDPVEGLAGWAWLHTGDVEQAIAVACELSACRFVAQVSVDVTRAMRLRGDPNDPRFGFQWHLENTEDPLFDINVRPVWDAGFRGAGIVIGIVEDAFQASHPDLIDRFIPEASQTGGSITSHATSVAGLAAATGRNGRYGLGVAYGAGLSSQLIGSDGQNAEALAFRNDLNDVKNNSWGPADIGFAFDLPPVVADALATGVESGRGGRGTVFVWAAGNGGSSRDRVDYDPYASSRYTIAVGAIGDRDTRPIYSEKGASLLVVAPSSGNMRSIYTLAYPSAETFNFGGTSAAAPIVSGVVALMLEANPALSWRDVQQVLVHSTRINDPNNPRWEINGAGLPIHESYGYGAVDAAAAVALARQWTLLPHEVVADSGRIVVDQDIPDNDRTGIRIPVVIDRDLRIESVELVLNVQSNFIGDLVIELTSPAGTVSHLASRRDDSQHDYTDYVFTSLRHIDERSAGTWMVTISDRASGVPAHWDDLRLRVYGVLPCEGDLDASGQVDLTDLALLLERLGACEADGDGRYRPEADLDNSHCNDLADLQILLSRFGTPCP